MASLSGFIGSRLEHLGLDRARMDGIDADAVSIQFESCAAAEST
jgi:hypothetical protein